jgi:uncharacterized membrane protein YoaK (UPF0700 family)
MKGSRGKEFWIILIGGMLLSFNAGHLNGTTLLQDHPTTTTHMTGNATSLGIALAQLNQKKILFYSLLLFSYAFGSFISGIIIPYQSFSIHLGYGRVFILVSMILSLSALIDLMKSSDFIIYDLLIACASGMQNGMVSRYSGNILRIGHVTGACTDIGVHVGRYLMGTTENLWRIQILMTLVLSFFFGGYIAQELHPLLGNYQLLFSASISFVIGLFYLLYLRLSQFHLSFRHSIFGTEGIDGTLVGGGGNERESIESQFPNDFQRKGGRGTNDLSFLFEEHDEDYDLTQEEAKQLHCKVTGELIDEDQLTQVLLQDTSPSLQVIENESEVKENHIRLSPSPSLSFSLTHLTV